MFKPVVGYEGIYEVSDDGVIKRVNRNKSIQSSNQFGKGYLEYVRKQKELILKPRIVNKYLTVALFKDGKYKYYRVHRLVAEAFIPNPHNKPQVNHKNANKLDNRVENLEWATAKENTQNAIKLGLRDDNINYFKRKVIMMSLDYKIIAVKDCSREMAEYLKQNFGIESNLETIARSIRQACKCNEIGLENLPKKRRCRRITVYGYKFMYLNDYSD